MARHPVLTLMIPVAHTVGEGQPGEGGPAEGGVVEGRVLRADRGRGVLPRGPRYRAHPPSRGPEAILYPPRNYVTSI